MAQKPGPREAPQQSPPFAQRTECAPIKAFVSHLLRRLVSVLGPLQKAPWLISRAHDPPSSPLVLPEHALSMLLITYMLYNTCSCRSWAVYLGHILCVYITS